MPYPLFRKKVESCIIKVKEINKIATYPEYKFVSPDILQQLELNQQHITLSAKYYSVISRSLSV